MWLIRCTRKLRQEMGIVDRSDIQIPGGSNAVQSEWYADLVRIGSKKLVVFTHATTLFVVVALEVRREEIRSLSSLLHSRLLRLLHHLEVPTSSLNMVNGWGTDSLYAPTASRQVLGSMNDQIRCLKFYIEQTGNVEQCNEVDLSLSLSEMPMRAIGYERSIDQFKTLLAEALQDKLNANSSVDCA